MILDEFEIQKVTSKYNGPTIASKIFTTYNYERRGNFLLATRDVIVKRNDSGKSSYFLCQIAQQFPEECTNLHGYCHKLFFDLRFMIKSLPQHIEIINVARGNEAKIFHIDKQQEKVFDNTYGFRISERDKTAPYKQQLKRKRIKEELKKL